MSANRTSWLRLAPPLALLLLGGCANLGHPSQPFQPIAWEPYNCYKTLADISCFQDQDPRLNETKVSGNLQPEIIQKSVPYVSDAKGNETAIAAATPPAPSSQMDSPIPQSEPAAEAPVDSAPISLIH